MEKLIELLNEYNEWWHWRDENFDKNKLLVISKGYWFIKWLVENDKIDTEKRPTRSKYRLQQYKTELWWYGNIDKYSELLMLLSIQDEPIDFLISILK